MKRKRRQKLATKIMNRILDDGLADSTFRDKYPLAYDELLECRLDMEHDVETILDGG